MSWTKKVPLGFAGMAGSLANMPGIHVIDLLPYFREIGADAVRCFQEPYDMHFSAYGNLLLADALQGEFEARGLLPALPESQSVKYHAKS